MIKKTLLKTCSYAVMHMSLSVLVAFALTHSWTVALAIGFLEPFVQTVGFFFHETAWQKFGDKSAKAHHDEVIDSVSPIARWIEKILHHKH